MSYFWQLPRQLQSIQGDDFGPLRVWGFGIDQAQLGFGGPECTQLNLGVQPQTKTLSSHRKLLCLIRAAVEAGRIVDGDGEWTEVLLVLVRNSGLGFLGFRDF